ncbi:hypothetical protein K435DRAFT_837206 [Dendrothele bispora CBS 962.96]|uniref:Uncharacterized protein n=1 Tax=Dendrothele bispora (strain CBS 962.96) TaxID=1314807 RepID=A0A4S8ME53_DENBC|nr:hypothetical protein K435DRAFT_837206 [Dendrothele bispora CBS 962.96]
MFTRKYRRIPGSLSGDQGTHASPNIASAKKDSVINLSWKRGTVQLEKVMKGENPYVVAAIKKRRAGSSLTKRTNGVDPSQRLEWLFRFTTPKQRIFAASSSFTFTAITIYHLAARTLSVTSLVLLTGSSGSLLPKRQLKWLSRTTNSATNAMPSHDVPREIRKTEEERRQDWINLMEAVGKLWFAAEEFWVRVKSMSSVSIPTPSNSFDSRLEQQGQNDAGTRWRREWRHLRLLIPSHQATITMLLNEEEVRRRLARVAGSAGSSTQADVSADRGVDSGLTEWLRSQRLINFFTGSPQTTLSFNSHPLAALHTPQASSALPEAHLRTANREVQKHETLKIGNNGRGIGRRADSAKPIQSKRKQFKGRCHVGESLERLKSDADRDRSQVFKWVEYTPALSVFVVQYKCHMTLVRFVSDRRMAVPSSTPNCTQRIALTSLYTPNLDIQGGLSQKLYRPVSMIINIARVFSLIASQLAVAFFQSLLTFSAFNFLIILPVSRKLDFFTLSCFGIRSSSYSTTSRWTRPEHRPGFFNSFLISTGPHGGEKIEGQKRGKGELKVLRPVYSLDPMCIVYSTYGINVMVYTVYDWRGCNNNYLKWNENGTKNKPTAKYIQKALPIDVTKVYGEDVLGISLKRCEDILSKFKLDLTHPLSSLGYVGDTPRIFGPEFNWISLEGLAPLRLGGAVFFFRRTLLCLPLVIYRTVSAAFFTLNASVDPGLPVTDGGSAAS